MKRTALFFMLLTFLAVVPVPTVTATTTPSNGRIVFSRFDPEADDSFTYIRDADGTVRPLFPDFTAGSPNWSPDGRHVAVISGLGQPCSPTTCSGHTVIIDPSDGSWRALPRAGLPRVGTFCSLWSPNGRLFACEGGNDSDTSVNGIYLIRSSDGGGLTRITDAGGMDDVPIAWSPDGSQLAFGRWDFGNCSNRSAIYVVNADGTGEHRITPWGFCDNHGDWSDDGKWIVFVKPGPNSIYLVHPDGRGLAKLTLAIPGRVYAGDVSWSPDGMKLVMLLFAPSGNANDYRDDYQEGIATANADGSHLRFVTVSPTFDHEPAWGARPE
jgi:Tol biopolymer transport system component